jgi:hypothetical protein
LTYFYTCGAGLYIELKAVASKLAIFASVTVVPVFSIASNTFAAFIIYSQETPSFKSIISLKSSLCVG